MDKLDLYIDMNSDICCNSICKECPLISACDSAYGIYGIERMKIKYKIFDRKKTIKFLKEHGIYTKYSALFGIDFQ